MNPRRSPAAGSERCIPPEPIDRALAKRSRSQYHGGVGWTPGATVGAYRLLETLGAGGAGAVWRAEELSTGAQRALKVMLDVDPESVVRFEREAQTLARLEHANVAKVHTAGEAFGRRYLVLDLATGGDLEARLRDHGALDPDEALRLLRDLCAGLAHVHAQGVLHRDLKPSNVIFADDGRPQLADFGLSRSVDSRSLTATGAILGTPSYMAPEQANGQPADERSDVYGLGGVLYAALTGQAPFRGDGTATLYAVLSKPPTPPRQLNPAIPSHLERVCLKALAKDPGDRYPTVRALAEALDERWTASPNYLAAGVAVVCALLAVIALAVVSARSKSPGSAPSTQVTEEPPVEVGEPPSPEPPAPAPEPPDPGGPHELDRRLGSFDPIREPDLSGWSSAPQRQALLAATDVTSLNRASDWLFAEKRPREAFVLLYQVGKLGPQLADAELRLASQRAWLELGKQLRKPPKVRRAVWPDEAWARVGPEVLAECSRRGAKAGHPEGRLQLGELYLFDYPEVFQRPPLPERALALFQQALELSTSEFEHARARLGLAWIAAFHPRVSGAPIPLEALDYAERVLVRCEGQNGSTEELARVARATLSRLVAEDALERVLGALPEVTSRDFAGYAPDLFFHGTPEQLLALENPNGLESAARWFCAQGEPEVAVALLYQVSTRGRALPQGDRRMTTQRGWFFLGDGLKQSPSSKGLALRPALWSDAEWRSVGWDVVLECYRRSFEAGRAEGALVVGNLHMGEDGLEFDRYRDLVEAQRWFRTVLEFPVADTDDLVSARLRLAQLAFRHPDLEERTDDAQALLWASRAADSLQGSRKESAEAIRDGLQARLGR